MLPSHSLHLDFRFRPGSDDTPISLAHQVENSGLKNDKNQLNNSSQEIRRSLPANLSALVEIKCLLNSEGEEYHR